MSILTEYKGSVTRVKMSNLLIKNGVVKVLVTDGTTTYVKSPPASHIQLLAGRLGISESSTSCPTHFTLYVDQPLVHANTIEEIYITWLRCFIGQATLMVKLTTYFGLYALRRTKANDSRFSICNDLYSNALARDIAVAIARPEAELIELEEPVRDNYFNGPRAPFHRPSYSASSNIRCANVSFVNPRSTFMSGSLVRATIVDRDSNTFTKDLTLWEVSRLVYSGRVSQRRWPDAVTITTTGVIRNIRDAGILFSSWFNDMGLISVIDEQGNTVTRTIFTSLIDNPQRDGGRRGVIGTIETRLRHYQLNFDLHYTTSNIDFFRESPIKECTNTMTNNDTTTAAPTTEPVSDSPESIDCKDRAVVMRAMALLRVQPARPPLHKPSRPVLLLDGTEESFVFLLHLLYSNSYCASAEVIDLMLPTDSGILEQAATVFAEQVLLLLAELHNTSHVIGNIHFLQVKPAVNDNSSTREYRSLFLALQNSPTEYDKAPAVAFNADNTHHNVQLVDAIAQTICIDSYIREFSIKDIEEVRANHPRYYEIVGEFQKAVAAKHFNFK